MRISRVIIALAALLVLVVLSSAAFAATLHGKIYDMDLNEINDVVVEVDSEPVQRFVSKDGGYSFELNPGSYVLTARYVADEFYEYSVEEQVTIKEEGDFVYDLFLFPDFDIEDEEQLVDEDIIDFSEPIIESKGMDLGFMVAIIAAVVVFLLIILYFFVGWLRRKEERKEIKEVENADRLAKKALRKEMDEVSLQPRKRPAHPRKESREVAGDLQKLVAVIKKEGGRTTQKELRRQIPLSEAKISLMITELEHKKMVQRVKKGRGNVVILKKH